MPAGGGHAAVRDAKCACPRTAIDLIITTAKMARFFEEIGRPVNGTLPAPSPEDVNRLVEASTRYGFTLATPEQNAAVGIEQPEFAG